jgi:hypothetical protein
MKYLVISETGEQFGQFSNQKDLTAFWNSELGLSLTIVQQFGRKGHKMTFVVRQIK